MKFERHGSAIKKSNFCHLHTLLHSFFCSTQNKIFWKLANIGPCWLSTYLLLHSTEQRQVWNEIRVSKLLHNYIFGADISCIRTFNWTKVAGFDPLPPIRAPWLSVCGLMLYKATSCSQADSFVLWFLEGALIPTQYHPVMKSSASRQTVWVLIWLSGCFS